MTAPSFRQRIAVIEEQIQRACRQHSVLAVWTAWLKYRRTEPDTEALPSLGIDNPHVCDIGPFIRLHDQLPEEYLAKERIVFYLNEDTLETRHAFMSMKDDPFAFSAHYTAEDVQCGWKAQSSSSAFDYTPEAIEAQHQDNVEFTRNYWTNLLDTVSECRVVHNGIHYVAHPSGVGRGFGGRQFRINWLDAALAPTVCNLSVQGKVPLWMRDRIPDNAIITTM